MKIVGSYTNVFSANLAKALLENNGIESYVLNENIKYTGVAAIPDMTGIDLAVDDKDYERASKLLAASSSEA